MATNDNPAVAGNVTDTTPIDALAGILDEPEPPENGEDEAHADDDAEAGGADEVADGIDAKSEEDPDEKTEADKQDGTPEPTGGRFVEHSARVKLPDGTTTTVAELAQGYFRQSDYSRKTQEIAETRQAVENERAWVSQTTQQLQHQLGTMTAMLDQWKPRRPETSPEEDPMGWLTYQQQSEAWKEWQGSLDAQAQYLYGQQWHDYQTRLASEARAFVQKFPAMSDPEKMRTFLQEASRTFGAKYGFSQEEIASIGDHRFLLVIRDVMRADRLSAGASAVKDQIKGKPKMVRGGRRGGDPSQDAKRARIDRLRETGSRADGVRSLMDLDL